MSTGLRRKNIMSRGVERRGPVASRPPRPPPAGRRPRDETPHPGRRRGCGAGGDGAGRQPDRLWRWVLGAPSRRARAGRGPAGHEHVPRVPCMGSCARGGTGRAVLLERDRCGRAVLKLERDRCAHAGQTRPRRVTRDDSVTPRFVHTVTLKPTIPLLPESGVATPESECRNFQRQMIKPYGYRTIPNCNTLVTFTL